MIRRFILIRLILAWLVLAPLGAAASASANCPAATMMSCAATQSACQSPLGPMDCGPNCAMTCTPALRPQELQTAAPMSDSVVHPAMAGDLLISTLGGPDPPPPRTE